MALEQINNGDSLGVVRTKINAGLSQIRKSRNLFDKSTVTPNKFVNWNDGTLATNSQFSASDFIEVSNMAYFNNKPIGPASVYLAYYDASKVFISGMQGGTYPITPPSTARYVRFSLNNNGVDIHNLQFEQGSLATSYEVFGYTFVNDAHQIDTKSQKLFKWDANGDSITNANYYQPKVQNWFKYSLTLVNHGISGTRLSGVSSDTSAMCGDYRLGLISTDANIITLLGGTNDWAQSIPLGDITSTDQTNYYGALRRWITYASTNIPNAKVFLFTPTYGNYDGSGWSDLETNTQGLKIKDYADAVRNMGKLYGISVVDLNANMGVNTFNLSIYSSDGIHWNDKGNDRIASIISGEFNKLLY